MAQALSSFPGMPFLTYRVKARLRKYVPGAELRLEPEEPLFRNTVDREVYTAYVGAQPVGRFTVRQTGSQIERVFFCVLPGQSQLPSTAMHEGTFSTASSVWGDGLRIASEQICLWLFLLIGERPSLLKLQPWRALADGGRNQKISLLGILSFSAKGVGLRHACCDIDGKPFVVIPSNLHYHGLVDASEELDLDAGGYCPTCRKLLCPEHLAFADVPDEITAEYNATSSAKLQVWRLVCREHGTLIMPPASPSQEELFRDLMQKLAQSLAIEPGERERTPADVDRR